MLLLPLLAQGQQLYLQNLPLKELSEQSGYGSFELMDCLEGMDGFIWLATQQGLFRYDGSQLHAYTADSLSAKPTVLYQSADSTLWVGYDNGQLAFLAPNQQQLVSFPTTLPNEIKAFASDARQRVWVATYGSGLYCLQADSLLQISSAQGLPDDYVYTLQADPAGNLWAGTDRGLGILSFEKEKPRVSRFSSKHGLPDNIVRSLALDESGQLWVGTESAGLCRIDPATRSIRWLPKTAWTFGSIQNLQLHEKQLWVSTATQGVLLFLTQQPEQLLSRIAQSSRSKVLMADRAGRAWISTPAEVLLADPSLLQWSLPAEVEQVFSLLPEANFCWLGTNQGLLRYSLRDQQIEKIFQTSNKEPISSLWRDKRNQLWCATLGDGLYRIKDGKIRRFSETEGLPNNNVLSVHGNGGDSLWISTLGGIVYYHLRLERFIPFQAAYPETNYVYDVRQAADGKLWFATDGEGAGYLDKGKSQALPDSLPSRNFYALRESPGSMLLLPAEGGLLRWQTDSLQRITRTNGLRNNQVLAMAQNKTRWLLALHAEGIDLAIPDLSQWKYLFRGDKNPVAEVYPNAVQADEQGNFWIGVAGQLLRIQPPAQGILPLQTRITGVQQLFSPVKQGKTVFNANQNHISFAYTALRFPPSELTQYQVYLEGFDADWQNTRNTQAIYPNLPAGTYTFKARAALNGLFRTNTPEAQYRFTILRPWWQSWWFLAAALAVTAGLIIGMVKVREQQLRQEARRKQEKTQLELQTLRSQINPHFLFNSFNTLITEIELSGKEAAPYAEALSDFFRNVLTHQEKNLIPLKEELELAKNYLYLQKKRFGEGLQFSLEVAEAHMNAAIPPLSLQQLLENALKHNMATANKPLYIALFTENNSLCIRNNRQARRQPIRSTGTGLENIRRRYRLLTDQDIHIVDHPNEFTVCLPLLKYD